MKRVFEATLEAVVAADKMEVEASRAEAGEEEVKAEADKEEVKEEVIKRPKRGESAPLYHWPGTPLATSHVRMTEDGTLPVVCIRTRGRECSGYIMDLFSRVPIESVEGAYCKEVARLGFRKIVKSYRCARGETAYRVQLSDLCEGNKGFAGVRSLLVRFVGGGAVVVSFYRIARIGAGRVLKCNRPMTEEAIADLGLLCLRASAPVPFSGVVKQEQ